MYKQRESQFHEYQDEMRPNSAEIKLLITNARPYSALHLCVISRRLNNHLFCALLQCHHVWSDAVSTSHATTRAASGVGQVTATWCPCCDQFGLLNPSADEASLQQRYFRDFVRQIVSAWRRHNGFKSCC